MPQPPDLLDRAYATLGVPRGCSRRALVKHYKRLVKRWHPDLYANDPQGQAEAAQRLREINRAFALVCETAPEEADTSRVAPPADRQATANWRAPVETRAPSDAATLGRYFFWAGSLGFAYLLIRQPGHAPKNTANFVAGMALLCVAIVHFARAIWTRDR